MKNPNALILHADLIFSSILVLEVFSLNDQIVCTGESSLIYGYEKPSDRNVFIVGFTAEFHYLHLNMFSQAELYCMVMSVSRVNIHRLQVPSMVSYQLPVKGGKILIILKCCGRFVLFIEVLETISGSYHIN